MKKFILFLLLSFILFGAFSTQAYADDSTTTPLLTSGICLYEKTNDSGQISDAYYYYLLDEADVYWVYLKSEKYILGFASNEVEYYGLNANYRTDFNTAVFNPNLKFKCVNTLQWNSYTFPYSVYLTSIYVSDPFSFGIFKEYENMNELLEDMKAYKDLDDFMNNKLPSGGADRLPLPTFSIKQAFTVADTASVKYTFSWKASEHQIYADNPNRYKLQFVASADIERGEVAGTSLLKANDITFINNDCKITISPSVPIYKESYSFLDREVGESLIDLYDFEYTRWDDSSSIFYFLFVRVIDPETEKTSLWKVYKCQGRFITPTGYYYDEEGNAYAGDDNDEIDDSTNYDSDPTTDADDDPDSPFYNDGAELDARHLFNNLKEIVETLKGIPELFEKVFLWMPNYLIVLIVTSIGLLVVVGFVKLFFH